MALEAVCLIWTRHALVQKYADALEEDSTFPQYGTVEETFFHFLVRKM